MPNEIPVIFQNGSNYGYLFIIKDLAREFEEEFECLGENTKKLKTFSVPIEKKVTKIDKDYNGSIVTISYKMKFIDSAKFMASSLSNLVDNLAEGIHKIKYKDCDCFFEYEINKDRSSKIHEKLKKKVKSTFKFSINDINKYVLLLIKGVYLYEYMDEWEKFNETTLPEEE